MLWRVAQSRYNALGGSPLAHLRDICALSRDGTSDRSFTAATDNADDMNPYHYSPAEWIESYFPLRRTGKHDGMPKFPHFFAQQIVYQRYR